MIYALLIAASTTCADAEQVMTILPNDEPIVEDAKRRWVEVGVSRREIEETTFPIVIWSFGERCVHFIVKPDLIGGQPTFCYEGRSDTFKRADTRVGP